MSNISNHDYSHAQKVWKGFDMKKLGEYHNLYLKTDMLLLSNMFEAFKSTCLKHYGLDPADFYTSSGLAWQACLKKTGIVLELLTDPDMLLMIERGIREEITQAVHQYAKANNKYLGDKFNHKEVSNFPQYLDANNLYGCVMIQSSQLENFIGSMRVNLHLIDNIEICANCENEGYLSEVDVRYAKELHDLYNDLPFMYV